MIKYISELTILPIASVTLIIIIILISYLVYKFIIKPYKQYQFYKRIVSQNYKALIHPFSILPLRNLQRQRGNIQKYGDSLHHVKYIYRDYQLSMSMSRGTVFLEVIDPQLIREFYERTMEGCYVKFVKSFTISPLRHVVGKGLIFSEENQWRMKRKIMSSVFNFDFIKSKVGFFSDLAAQVLDKVQNQPQNKGQSQIKMDLNLALQEIFGNITIRCFFGNVEFKEIENQSVFKFCRRIFEIASQMPRSLFAVVVGQNFYKYKLRAIDRQFMQKNQVLNEYAKDIVSEIIQNTIKKESTKQANSSGQTIDGVVDLLIKQNKLKYTEEADTENVASPKKDFYTIQDLIDEFKNFFFAGTDTTSNNTTVLTYLLSKQTDIQQKLREEIQKVLNNDVRNLTYEKLKEMKYLQNVQKQILRIHSPTSGIFIREAVKDHFLGKIPIKAGMMVKVMIKTNHYKDTFYEHPEQFNPDRWNNIDASKADPFSYFPFSSGQRNCIGQHLALIESKIAIIHILLRYKQIVLQKPNYRFYYRTLYGAEKMTTTFTK